jgi:hypothetical protein
VLVEVVEVRTQASLHITGHSSIINTPIKAWTHSNGSRGKQAFTSSRAESQFAAVSALVVVIAVVKSKFPLWSSPSVPEPPSNPLSVILDVVDWVWLMRVTTFVVELEAASDVDVGKALSDIVVADVVVAVGLVLEIVLVVVREAELDVDVIVVLDVVVVADVVDCV